MDFYHSLAKEIYVAKRSARANRLGALVLSIGLITGLGACSPVHTLDIFDPSDGVRAVLDGEVKATNLLILTEAQGEPGTLVGSLTNTAGTDLEVAVTVGEEEPILTTSTPATPPTSLRTCSTSTGTRLRRRADLPVGAARREHQCPLRRRAAAPPTSRFRCSTARWNRPVPALRDGTSPSR